MAKDVENLQIKIDLESGDFASQIKSITSALSSLEKQFKTLDKGLDNDSFEHYALQIDKAKKSIELLNKQIETQKKAQTELNKTLEEQKKKRDGMDKDSKEYAKLDKQIAKNQRTYDNMTNAITRNQQKIKGFSNEILNANIAIQKLSDNSKTLEEKLSKVTSNNDLKMSGLNKDLEQTGSFFKKIGLEIDKLNTEKGFNTSKIKLYNQEISKLEATQKKLRNQQKQLQADISNHESALANAKSEYGETSDEVSKLEMSLASLKDELRGVNQELDSNHDSLNDYKTQVNDLERENTKLDKSLASTKFDMVGDKLGKWGDTLKNIGSTLTQNVTAPLTAVGLSAAKMGMDYQTALTKVGIITKMEGKELQDFGKEIIKISNDTGIASTDLLESVYQAVSSGVEVGNAIDFVSASANLARAGFADQVDVVDLLTNAYNVYGDTLGDVTSVTDKFVKAQDLGKFTIGQIAGEMSEAMAIGETYGISLDQVLASYVKLTKSGYSAAESTM